MKHAIVIIAAAGFAAQAYAADTASQLNAQELARIQSGAPAAMAAPAAGEPALTSECPPGTHWVPAGYIKHSKWRPAGCRYR